MKKIVLIAGGLVMLNAAVAYAAEGDDKKNELGLQSNIYSSTQDQTFAGTTTSTTSSNIDAMGYWGHAFGSHIVFRVGIGANLSDSTNSSSGSLFLEPGIKYKFVVGHTFVPYMRAGLMLGTTTMSQTTTNVFTGQQTTTKASSTLTGGALAVGVSKYINESISADLELFARQSRYSMTFGGATLDFVNTQTGLHLGVTSYF